MARDVEIPITDDGSECTQYYSVSYKLNGDVGYTTLEPQYSEPIIVNNLLDDEIYNFRIIRFCCNGTQSDPAEFNVDTTLSP